MKVVWMLSCNYQNLGVYFIAFINIIGLVFSILDVMNAFALFICKQPLSGANQIMFYRKEIALPVDKRAGKFVQNEDGCVLYIHKDQQMPSFENASDEQI